MQDLVRKQASFKNVFTRFAFLNNCSGYCKENGMDWKKRLFK